MFIGRIECGITIKKPILKYMEYQTLFNQMKSIESLKLCFGSNPNGFKRLEDIHVASTLTQDFIYITGRYRDVEMDPKTGGRVISRIKSGSASCKITLEQAESFLLHGYVILEDRRVIIPCDKLSSFNKT